MQRIGRYDNPYAVGEWHREPPAGTTCEPLTLETPDRGIAHGWLYVRCGEDPVVCLMHPRANFSRHDTVPGLVDLTQIEIEGDHYGFPAETGREGAVAAIIDWLKR